MLYKPAEASIALWRVRAFIIAVIPSFLCGVFWEFNSPSYWIGTASWLLVLAGVLYLYIPLWYRSCKYLLEEEKVSVYVGVLFRKERIIGRASIQYASVYQTLLQRIFKVATVELHAAGGRVFLQNLEQETALQISREVLKKNKTQQL